MKFQQAYDGVWIQPVRAGWQMACCDCGLVHDVSFRILNGRIQLKAYRNKKSTYNRRRTKKILNSLKKIKNKKP